MILGMTLSTFTLFHVALSLVGIAAGLVVLACMLRSRRLPGWTAVFLLTMVLTSATGFLFRVAAILPSHIVGVVSLAVLGAAILARYIYRLAGAWRWIYVSGALTALWLNVFVGVVQAFAKPAFLTPLAPTQSEPPFLIAQGAALALFMLLGGLAVRAFHPVNIPARRPEPVPSVGHPTHRRGV
jgi:hypothetical protein